MEAQLSGFVRSVLYPYQMLGQNFRICISSHVDYVSALDRLFRSLNRIKFPKDNVTVVVGGAGAVSEETRDGWKLSYVPRNLDGFIALTTLPLDWDGWYLLLHDTCEVAEDFIPRASQVDVGLTYDMILPSLAPCEIGFYSSAFIRLLADRDVFTGKTPVTLDLLKKHSRLYHSSVSTVRHVATKDVYGTGIMRDVLYLDSIGIKKYRRVKGAAAKP
jgi:hypothetical protein